MRDEVVEAISALVRPGRLVRVSDVAARVPHASRNAIGRMMTALGGERRRGPVERNGQRHWGYHFEVVPPKASDEPPYVMVGTIGGIRLYVERGQAGRLST